MRDRFGIFGAVIRIRKLSLLLVMTLRMPNNASVDCEKHQNTLYRTCFGTPSTYIHYATSERIPSKAWTEVFHGT
jgi:hypothetical protein